MPFQLRPCALPNLAFATSVPQSASISAFLATCYAIPFWYFKAIQAFEFSQLLPFSSFPVVMPILPLAHRASVAILLPLLYISLGILELFRSPCALESHPHCFTCSLGSQCRQDREQPLDQLAFVH